MKGIAAEASKKLPIDFFWKISRKLFEVISKNSELEVISKKLVAEFQMTCRSLRFRSFFFLINAAYISEDFSITNGTCIEIPKVTTEEIPEKIWNFLRNLQNWSQNCFQWHYWKNSQWNCLRISRKIFRKNFIKYQLSHSKIFQFPVK